MNRLATFFGAVAAIALFAMMALTFADVFARKFLGNSIIGAVELTELFMLTMIYFALPLASRAGEHIVFDLLDRVLPAALQRWQQSLANLLTAVIFGAAASIVWQRATRSAEYGDMTSSLEIVLWPFHRMVAVMLVVTALAHLWLAWRALREEPA
ncbi:MAG TPA: TRAP transporter small permease [Rubrivivax sp.]|nr:TRAP transporter small permease [Rhodoferax sp.]MCL4738801.1 TRAP transporter small permease [Burkholderiaceae bacterium]MCP5290427.1 TRAP transporter small permease [Burkholderiaceae bacterium]HMQ72184.1 TRAP transporter small permease [Rubrivivax sp.]HMR68694.1 TRAP transporter small permease [Rubrivivax sp.]